jgi:hypothetical protein
VRMCFSHVQRHNRDRCAREPMARVCSGALLWTKGFPRCSRMLQMRPVFREDMAGSF